VGAGIQGSRAIRGILAYAAGIRNQAGSPRRAGDLRRAGCGGCNEAQEKKAEPMKATIEIDCTPDELRATMGLPDVKPLQANLMADLERRMKDAADRMSPENIIKSWFSLVPAQSEQFRNLINAMMPGAGKSSATPDKKEG
jgi:hypothetical protein